MLTVCRGNMLKKYVLRKSTATQVGSSKKFWYVGYLYDDNACDWYHKQHPLTLMASSPKLHLLLTHLWTMLNMVHKQNGVRVDACVPFQQQRKN